MAQSENTGPAFVKCREKGRKTWAFLTPGAGLNRLRVHAARFDTLAKAQALIDENAADNPEWDFKAVPAIQRRTRREA
jgi:hypothetical protein